MQTKLHVLAMKRIELLAQEAQAVVLKNHENMGHYTHTDSGFGQLNTRLYEIQRWAEALREGA